LTTWVIVMSALSFVHSAPLETIACATVDVQQNFNLTNFVEGGKWYIHQQMAIIYMPARENYCVTASYAFTSNNTVHVSNYANDGKVNGGVYSSDSMLKAIGGICGSVDDPNEPAKLSVGPCDIPAWLPESRGPYWVIAAGPNPQNYDWALVSGGQPTKQTQNGCQTGRLVNYSGLWILTRSSKRDEAVVQAVRKIAHDAGFDLSVLADVQQEGCTYAPH